MAKSIFIILTCAALVLGAAGCMSEPGIDAQKFAAIDRAVNELRTALTASAPCAVPETLEQRISAQLAAVKDSVSSKGERDLVDAYAQVLTTYRDGLLLCRSRSHLKSLRLIPEGRILVTQEVEPLVDKYGLESARHVYPPTGQMISSIDGSAIGAIWERARAQIRNAENILYYH